jgi:beta-lactam-binding protein with PASTA domain
MKRCLAAVAAALTLTAVVVAPAISVADDRPGHARASAMVSVPSVNGKSLPAAKAKVYAAGLVPVVKGGGLFGVVVESNWVVCGSTPSAGSRVRSGTSVKLFVARSC